MISSADTGEKPVIGNSKMQSSLSSSKCSQMKAQANTRNHTRRKQIEPTKPDPSPTETPKPVVHSFCKVLTASDTSTHGGFSVLRKHATECLPALDMNQQTPTQELAAKDLHGYTWRFKHIYRGQPRRHLLTTGWSHFVTSKRLVAGDSFVFLRGETGDLRVGVRRVAHHQSCMPPSVISSQSMHLGVLATLDRNSATSCCSSKPVGVAGAFRLDFAGGFGDVGRFLGRLLRRVCCLSIGIGLLIAQLANLLPAFSV